MTLINCRKKRSDTLCMQSTEINIIPYINRAQLFASLTDYTLLYQGFYVLVNSKHFLFNRTKIFEYKKKSKTKKCRISK